MSDRAPAPDGTPPRWRVRADCRCELGEGLFWDVRGQRVWFTDILRRSLISAAADGSQLRVRQAQQRLGWAIRHRSGDAWLLGLQQGFAQALTSDEELQTRWVARVFPDRSPLRLNDAKADSSGAVWAGSMDHDDSSRPDGCLYRLAVDGTLTVQDTGYHVANGPAISPDERLMLHTDSALRTIYAFDLDVDAGQIANKRIWLRLDEDEGYPDGMCFDAEGCVWVAHWDGGCITRHDPLGQVIQRVDLPAPRITNVCFGGADLDRIFVTSARVGLDADALARFPMSGALFEVDSRGVRGLAPQCWGGG